MAFRGFIRSMTQGVAAGILAAGLVISLPTGAAAIPSEITYQAQLLDSTSGLPIASNNVDLTIRVYPSQSASIADATFTFSGVDLSATGGYVSFDLDPSTLDLSGDLWIEVDVDDLNDSDPVETLTPRQKVTSVPFALNSATLEGDTLLQVQTFAQNQAQAAQVNAELAITQAFANINRAVFVNPNISQSTLPEGTLDDPFDNIQDAYNFAKTNFAPISFQQRVAVVLMPGVYTQTATLLVDYTGVDVIGLLPGTVFINGVADPVVQLDADNLGLSAANLQHLRIRATGTSNVAFEARSGGRLVDVGFDRPGVPAPAAGNLVDINIPSPAGPAGSLAFSDIELYGGMTITSYPDQITFDGGFIQGVVVSTATATDLTDVASFSNMSSIGAISFLPSSPSILAINNVSLISGFTYNISTQLNVTNSSFFDLSGFPPGPLPIATEPAAGSVFVNVSAAIDPTGWGGTLVPSAGNVPLAYTAYLGKL